MSWAYLVGDVGYEGYKAYLQNQRTLHPGLHRETSVRAIDGRDGAQNKPLLGHVPAIEDYRSVMLQRAIFQSVASMGLPAFTIHSIVRYSGRALKDAKNTRIRTYGPIGVSGFYTFNTILADASTIAWPSGRTIPAIPLRQTGRTRSRMEFPQSF